MAKDLDLGNATSYSYYVSEGGTKTPQEFGEMLVNIDTVASRAEESASDAEESATSANESKESAIGAKDIAIAKANEASASADVALNKAGEASASATVATNKATEASASATTASAKATESSQNALTAVGAKNDAVSAKNDAVTAKTQAQSAKDDAVSAKLGAESARNEVQSSANQIAQNASDIAQLKSEFTALESDGVVPSAEQILTDKGVTDCVPYHYRKTGGDGADRLYDQIVGGTVNWNQLARSLDSDQTKTDAGVTGVYVKSKNEWTLSGTSNDRAIFEFTSSFVFVGGHRYLFDCGNFVGSETTVRFWLESTDAFPVGNRAYNYGRPRIVTASANGGAAKAYAQINASGVVLDNVKIKLQVFDLTAMFGSTIADYIYSLETAHAGDGLAFFKALFPNDYYEYNSGELISVSGLSGHKMVGFNQWDEEWENGYISSTGELQNNAYYFRSKNYIQIFPETTYFYKCPTDYSDYARFSFYDADKRFLSYVGTSSYIDWTFTTPANAHYMKFTTGEKLNKSEVSYRGDICINLSDPAKNGQYEPYKTHSYPLDSTLTLRGLFTLDANNNLYADGDTYDADGTVTRKYGVVDLGTLNWNKSSTTAGAFATTIPSTYPAYKYANNTKMICSNYVFDGNGYSPNYYGADGTIRYYHTSSGNPAYELYVVDNAKDSMTTAEFKSAMSGVMLVYELETPTTEQAQPYQHLQQCDPYGTEEYVSTGIVPVGHNSFYPENLRAKVDGLPWNFASLIAPTESAFVATRNYVTGDLFIVSNVLYKATSNIANGGTITPNTNCTATTLAEIISALA